ncbi:hypothetical protein ABE61_22540 [Lysinibacillus sphaericus]|uniref:hypothetical protein n=1 Tax=Lysinibacillus sphaericus TaxID=1421 RepID=UPI0018CEC129|nr:hypothetical protein [Lysinibacillus sphaericus]MBG9456714.1 hypothetical protein [Lysinibacillus sphaericus]MBG9476877.1 hypothetical protein [Lysinibacillus sphaericus]MBG9591426.1 hypothetical protein [Lysinibacillus sphaericus]
MKKALLLLLAVMLVGCSGEGAEKKKEADVKKEDVVTKEPAEEKKVVPVKFEEVDPESKAAVEKLVKKYNVKVDVIKQDPEDPIEIDKISEPITSELYKEENNTFSQILLETDFKQYKGHYKVEAKYNNDKKIIGYGVSMEGVPENEVNEEGDEWGEGITSAISMAAILGVNVEKLGDELEKAGNENKGTHTYTDPNTNHNVTFLIADMDLGKIGINFDLTK